MSVARDDFVENIARELAPRVLIAPPNNQSGKPQCILQDALYGQNQNDTCSKADPASVEAKGVTRVRRKKFLQIPVRRGKTSSSVSPLKSWRLTPFLSFPLPPNPAGILLIFGPRSFEHHKMMRGSFSCITRPSHSSSGDADPRPLKELGRARTHKSKDLRDDAE